ncbi:hypothetical protein ACFWH4_01155 [Streptomyces sp. NPDC127091]|uniref:hypothetical protein n=1 Tax=Streptomyces sp. NPDC127091 TaxID=3347134 RepID=UPI0036659AFD
MDPFAPLGRTMDVGSQHCTYSPGDIPANDCGETAAWHILWDPNGDAGLACGPHMGTARHRFVFVDVHRVGPDCNMPGTAWSFDEKRCIYPGEPDAIAAAAEMPAREAIA